MLWCIASEIVAAKGIPNLSGIEVRRFPIARELLSTGITSVFSEEPNLSGTVQPRAVCQDVIPKVGSS